jgi:hypothetical protein
MNDYIPNKRFGTSIVMLCGDWRNQGTQCMVQEMDSAARGERSTYTSVWRTNYHGVLVVVSGTRENLLIDK